MIDNNETTADLTHALRIAEMLMLVALDRDSREVDEKMNRAALAHARGWAGRLDGVTTLTLPAMDARYLPVTLSMSTSGRSVFGIPPYWIYERSVAVLRAALEHEQQLTSESYAAFYAACRVFGYGLPRVLFCEGEDWSLVLQVVLGKVG